MGGTERTIKAHRHRVMEKMQVRSLPELVSLAERVGVGSGRTGGLGTTLLDVDQCHRWTATKNGAWHLIGLPSFRSLAPSQEVRP